MTEQEYFADEFEAGIMTPGEELELYKQDAYEVDFDVVETVSTPTSRLDASPIGYDPNITPSWLLDWYLQSTTVAG